MSLIRALSLSRRASLGFAAMGVLWGSFAAQVPVLKTQTGADDALFGLILLGGPIGLILTMWVAPAFDRWLGVWSLPASGGVIALAFLLPGFATTPVMLGLAMLAMGFASGLLDIVSNARVSEREAATNAPLMNANHGVFSLAYAVSALATGVAREGGMTPAMIFPVLALAVAVLAPFMRMPVVTVSADARRAVALPLVIVALCGGITLVAFFVEAVVESWSALHIERTLGGRATEGALGPALLGLTMAAGRFSGQLVTGRVGEVPMIVGGGVLAACGSVLAATAQSPGAAYMGFAMMGAGVSVIGPLGLGLAGRMVPPAHRVTAVAWVNVIAFTCFFFAPLMMGFVSEAHGLRMAFACVAGIALIAPVLMLVLSRQKAVA